MMIQMTNCLERGDRNSENYHFGNNLCAYQTYDIIPELFTFFSRVGSKHANGYILHPGQKRNQNSRY